MGSRGEGPTTAVSVRSVFPPREVIQSATPADRTVKQGCLQGWQRWPAAKCSTFAYFLYELRLISRNSAHNDTNGVTTTEHPSLSFEVTPNLTKTRGGTARRAGLHLTVSLPVAPIGLPHVRSPASQGPTRN